MLYAYVAHMHSPLKIKLNRLVELALSGIGAFTGSVRQKSAQ